MKYLASYDAPHTVYKRPVLAHNWLSGMTIGVSRIIGFHLLAAKRMTRYTPAHRLLSQPNDGTIGNSFRPLKQ